MARLVEPFMTYNDDNGAPLSGGKLQFNVSGSPTLAKDTFFDAALTSGNENPNPIVLDSAGRVPDSVVDVFGAGDYRLIVKNSADVEQETFDPIGGAASTTVETYAALKALADVNVAEDQLFYVVSRTDPNDGGEGPFTATTSTPGADNGGTILHSDTGNRFFERQFNGMAVYEWFGAVADNLDGSAGANHTAIQACMDSGLRWVGAGKDGTYRVNNTLTPASNQRISGTSMFRSNIKMVDSVTGKPLMSLVEHGLAFEHLTMGWVSPGQTVANSTIFQFGETTGGIDSMCGWGAMNHVRLENGYRLMDVDQSAVLAGFFSWTFDHLYLRQFENKGLFFLNVGAGNSGFSMDNVYGPANARAGSQQTGFMLDFREIANLNIGLINIEANRTDGTPWHMQNVTGSIQNIHIESVDCDGMTGADNGILDFLNKCILDIGNIQINDLGVPAGADRCAVIRSTATAATAAFQPRITIDNLDIINTSSIIPASEWNLIRANSNVDASAGAQFRIMNVRTEKAFDSLVDGGTGDILKAYSADTNQFNMDSITYGSGNSLVTSGTVTPEGAVTAGPGSLYLRNAGAEITKVYQKNSGSSNIGWLPLRGWVKHSTVHTAVASGTSIEWTGLPADVQNIRIVFSDQSFSNAAELALELGDSGGYETSGYSGLTNNVAGSTGWSAEGLVTRNAAAVDILNGFIIIDNITGNLWGINMQTTVEGGGATEGAGDKTLSAVLDRVRLISNDATGTFDGTGINAALYYQ